MSDKVLVKFLKGWGNFIKDDLTKLDRETVEMLLKNSIVIIFGEEEFDITDEEKESLPNVEHKPDLFICPICGKEYKTERGLLNHKKKEHNL